ncbi:MAG: helix-turn-helix domain-containing protein [Sedimentisphaerales bacterium]|nr:helix-turn-helix domain-containing protein [Sedimentisphaerales bacterium]
MQTREVKNSEKTNEHTDYPSIQLLTIADVASILKVSKDYVRKLAKENILYTVKMPGGRNGPVRIPAASVRKFIHDSRTISKPHLDSAVEKRRNRNTYRGVFSE